MDILNIIGIFVIWTIFWSLWSVLLTRLQENISRDTIKWILFWFSRCPHCKKRLHAQNLIPVVSYLKQQWKCAFCHKKISPIYPILEISSGIVFVLSYILVYNMLSYMVPDAYKLSTLVFRSITNRWLLLMIIYDIQKHELHMPMRIFTTIWILLWQFLWHIGSYKYAVVWSLIFTGAFIGIYFFAKRYSKIRFKQKQEWFGQGDIYIGFLLGTLSPFVCMYNLLEPSFINTLKYFITLLILSSFLWIVYYWIGELIKRNFKIWHNSHHDLHIKWAFIPFIPALIVAFWILVFKADKIISLFF